jgi:hypothetical protein
MTVGIASYTPHGVDRDVYLSVHAARTYFPPPRILTFL